ncbi:hypothetical protein [Thauera sinica]|uniref:Uncharacterized protein n=1 Tax=Thauera sinica TaxID=2665146 RepID=A0ABW1AXR0_9RHOO|nr:hypothetical protein [Thauera sp. K11]
MSTPNPRHLAGNQRRTLYAMYFRLINMAATWDGINQYVMAQLVELADQVADVATDLVEPDQDEPDKEME